MIKRSIIIFAIIILASSSWPLSSLMSMLLPNLLCCYHFCHFDRKPLNHDYVYISFHHYHPCHFLHPYYHQQTSNHKHQSYNSRLEVQFEGLNPLRMSLKSLRIGGFLILKGSLKLKPNPSSSNPHPRIGGFLKLQTTNLKQGLRFGLKDKNF